MTSSVDWKDVQGLVRYAYGQAPKTAFCLLQVVDRAAAKRWLAALHARVSRAENATPPPATLLNIAFTLPGLRRFGLREETLATFPRAFREGMTTPYRSRLLGDIEANRPTEWYWGGPGQSEDLHVLLMIYADTDEHLAKRLDEERANWDGALRILPPSPLRAYSDVPPESNVEHFGFRDGVSQPVIDDVHTRPTGEDEESEVEPVKTEELVKTGEFVLGYENEFGQVPLSPDASAERDARGNHSPVRDGCYRNDLGLNGTFLVMRQLEQDVTGFWNFIRRASQARASAHDPLSEERLAAKMIGRWRDGSPLVTSPDRPNHERERNDFGFRDEDASGLRCPIGAHIRRANPRDSLIDSSSGSYSLVRLHRMVRRGRKYGSKIPYEWRFVPDNRERGLFFVALVASIERQFEFMQGAWINGSQFGGLVGERDPLMGNPGSKGLFTIPDTPCGVQIGNIPLFIAVRGGAYFFLPSLSAIAFLARPH